MQLKEVFKGEVGNSHIIENGDADGENHSLTLTLTLTPTPTPTPTLTPTLTSPGENHWDKFLETPVAQAAIEREMEELKTY